MRNIKITKNNLLGFDKDTKEICMRVNKIIEDEHILITNTFTHQSIEFKHQFTDVFFTKYNYEIITVYLCTPEDKHIPNIWSYRNDKLINENNNK